MQILLLVAMVAVGVSGLYVAVSFDTRVTRKVDRLIREGVASGLEAQLRSATDRLVSKLDAISANTVRGRNTAQEGVDALKVQIRQMDSKFPEIIWQINPELEAVKEAVHDIGTGQSGLDSLVQDLSGRVQAIAQQVQAISGQAAGISVGAERSEALAQRNFAGIHASLQEMSEAQLHARAQLAGIDDALAGFAEMNHRRESNESWIAGQLVDIMRQTETILRSQRDIIGFLCSGLDEEALSAAADHDRRVVCASLRISGSADDIIRELLLSFCDRMMFRVLLTAPPDCSGCGLYLAWTSPDGRSLEDTLATVLTECPDEEVQDHPGLDELRSLLLALHEEGPGTVQVGPMILNRTPRALLGYVLAAGEAAGTSPARLPESPGECEEWLRGLGEGRVTDLTSWAGSYPA